MIEKHSDNCTNLVMQSEGCKLQAYLCPAGVLTIGYGHTGHDVYEGKVITQERAVELLNEDLHFVDRFVANINPGWNQNQFDSIVDFAYNLGGNALKTSTLLKKAQIDVNDPAIADEFCKWVYSNHKILPGLVTRREKEVKLYFT